MADTDFIYGGYTEKQNLSEHLSQPHEVCPCCGAVNSLEYSAETKKLYCKYCQNPDGTSVECINP